MELMLSEEIRQKTKVKICEKNSDLMRVDIIFQDELVWANHHEPFAQKLLAGSSVLIQVISLLFLFFYFPLQVFLFVFDGFGDLSQLGILSADLDGICGNPDHGKKNN